jgi:quercetin dioxygenase-like cupin family protein
LTVRETRESELSKSKQTFDLFGVQINFLASPLDTGAELSMFKGKMPSGTVVPLHCHRDPEVLYVLEGELEVYRHTGIFTGWHTATAGDVVIITGGQKHALRNHSDRTTTLLLLTKEDLYNFFYEVAVPLENADGISSHSAESMQKLFKAAASHHYWMGSAEENASIGITLA